MNSRVKSFSAPLHRVRLELLSSLLAFLCADRAALAAKPPAHPPGYVCGRATGEIAIDGKLDDQAWRTAKWTDLFVDIQGDLKPKQKYNTRVKMLWDDHFFYIAAELEEPNVWALLTEHDSVIFHDNDFEVFIDPDGDRGRYYEIEVNALGTEWDLYLERSYRDQGSADSSWEVPGLKVATHVGGTINNWSDKDHGWTVELAIPWKVLGVRADRPVPPREGDQWRVNFSRVEWSMLTTPDSLRKDPAKVEDNWVWAPQGVIDMHRPEHWGYVQFTKKPADQVPFVPDPTSEARLRVAGVYDAQHEFRRLHGRWAKSYDELDLSFAQIGPGDPRPEMVVNDRGFEISYDVLPSQDKQLRRVHIQQDGKMVID